MPNLVTATTPTTSPPPRHSRLSPLQPAPPQSHHHATLCRHASHPVAPTLTHVAGTHQPCRPLTKMSFLSFFSFFPFIKLFQDNSYHINVTPISLMQTQATPSPSQPRRPATTTVAASTPTPGLTTTIATSTPLHTTLSPLHAHLPHSHCCHPAAPGPPSLLY